MRVSRFAQFTALGVAGFVLLTACPRTPEPHPPATPGPPTPTPLPTPPTPTPPPYVPNKKLEVGKMFNGMQYKVTLETEHGTTATHDRNEMGSYAAELTVKVKVPKPHHDLDEIKRINPALPEVLPALPTLLASAKISPAFDELYRLKCASLRSNLMRLDVLLSRHNFFDCETILELQHPQTKRRALLVQADMDVDTDGSDPDRVPEIAGASSTYEPFTSFRWARKTQNPSVFIPVREAKLKQCLADLAVPGLSPARRAELKQTEERLQTELADLKRYSFLVGTVDPFVVLPGSMFGKGKSGPFAPSVGDFCVVVYRRAFYPAVVGDVGPMKLAGEASLRICRAINPRADAENRPTNDLNATYLVFPGTAEKYDAPDLAHWRERCEELLGELGGYTGELYSWEDLTKPKIPPATPAPNTPAPATPSSGTPPASPSQASTPKASPSSITPGPTTPAPTTPKSASPAPSTPKPEA